MSPFRSEYETETMQRLYRLDLEAARRCAEKALTQARADVARADTVRTQGALLLALHQTALVYYYIGERALSEQGIAYHEEMLTAAERLYARHPVPQTAELLAKALVYVAEYLREPLCYKTAEDCYRRACELLRDSENKALIAVTLDHLGDVAFYTDRTEEAEAHYRAAYELRVTLTPTYEIRHELAFTHHRMAWICRKRGDTDGTLRELRATADALEKLARDFPLADAQLALANAYLILGKTLDNEETDAYIQKAIDIGRTLSEALPDNPLLRRWDQKRRFRFPKSDEDSPLSPE